MYLRTQPIEQYPVRFLKCRFCDELLIDEFDNIVTFCPSCGWDRITGAHISSFPMNVVYDIPEGTQVSLETRRALVQIHHHLVV